VVGLWYQPHPRFEIGFSSRPLPVHLRSSGSFTLTPQGQTMTNILESMLSVTDNSVNLGLNLPAWFRGGFRYRHLDAQGKELFDIEADFVYEMWSVLENFDVSLGQGFSVTFDEDQDPEPIEVAPMQIPKKYKDTYSVRLGSTVHLDEDFELHGGAFYESGASPKTHTNIDFTASERVGVTTGFTYTFGSYALTAAYGHVFQPDQVVSAEETEIYQLHPVSPCTPPYEENCHASNPGKPPGVPAGGGRFESSFHVLSLGLTMSFGEGN